jgi:hypothetical protein
MSNIYVLSNPLFPEYIKIGRTECMYSRLKKLSTGVAKAYNVELCVEVKDSKKTEKRLHEIYGKQGWMLNLGTVGREWYKIGKGSIFDTVEDFIEDIKRELVKVKYNA